MNNTENKKLADLLFPEVTQTTDFFIKKYTQRTEGQVVTRFAPSPTGFVHIGGLFTALISERLAHSNNGIFFLRVEDTDKKREVQNGVQELTSSLSRFGIKIDEGILVDEKNSVGNYGPYLQSERKEIYLAFIKYMVEQGNAYPCFCTTEELDESRKKQEELKIRPGYYAEWAVHRNISLEKIKQNISEGRSFVIRLKSNGSDLNKFKFKDEVKGDVSVTENDQDIILLKSDNLPTYHFAHIIDDHLMGTTHVIRGDEWLSSLPIHLQIFRIFGWAAPKYGHVSPILKLENGNKRKLSKRKDPEAAVEYYLKHGYPNDAVIEYLLNIANSDFEDWRKINPQISNEEFNIKLTKLSKSGALFDEHKLINISKDIISRMTVEQVYDLTLAWAHTYDNEFESRLIAEKEYFIKIFSIEREGTKPRKDFSKWSDVKENIFYFFDDLFANIPKDYIYEYPQSVDDATRTKILKAYSQRILSLSSLDKESWFADLKLFANENDFCTDMKVYKFNPESFKGTIGDIAMILRVALTSRTQTPDLYEIIRVLGIEKVSRRLQNS